MYEDRIAQAVENFKNGYNCSQSVVAAFSDLYGLDRDLALKLSTSFGGGIGRMHETCGAACGMFMLAGLDSGSSTAGDKEGKSRNYAIVQQLAAEFKAENGSLNCGELLGLRPMPDGKAAKPKRPCVMMVETAARIFARYLEDRKKNANFACNKF